MACHSASYCHFLQLPARVTECYSFSSKRSADLESQMVQPKVYGREGVRRRTPRRVLPWVIVVVALTFGQGQTTSKKKKPAPNPPANTTAPATTAPTPPPPPPSDPLGRST